MKYDITYLIILSNIFCRCSLNDSKQAIKLKSDYAKSLERAARCCLRVKDFDQCNELCDKILRIFPEERVILDLKRQIILSDVKSLL